MSASMIRLSVPPSGTMASLSPSGAAPKPRPAAAPAVAAAPLRVRPAWPDPATIYLAGELLELSKTNLAYTASIGVPETGADFWAMLATALREGKRE